VALDLDADHPGAVCTRADRLAPLRRLRAAEVRSP